MACLNDAMAVAVSSDAERPHLGKFLRASKAFEPGVPQKNLIWFHCNCRSREVPAKNNRILSHQNQSGKLSNCGAKVAYIHDEDLVLREEPLLRLRRWPQDALSAAPRLREASQFSLMIRQLSGKSHGP